MLALFCLPFSPFRPTFYLLLFAASLIWRIDAAGHGSLTLGNQSPSKGFISCIGKAPDVEYPKEYSQSYFDTSQKLCAAGATRGRNMGCKCESPGKPPSCRPPLARADLWLNQPLLSHCKKSCKCYETPFQRPESQLWSEDSGASSSTSQSFEDEEAWETYVAAQMQAEAAENDAFFRTRYGGASASSSSSSCGSPCSSVGQCLSGAILAIAGGCQCFAVRSRSSKGGIFFGGMCRTYPKKRDLLLNDLACPCNATYVSSSCCRTTDGLVWESPEFKLGRLM